MRIIIKDNSNIYNYDFDDYITCLKELKKYTFKLLNLEPIITDEYLYIKLNEDLEIYLTGLSKMHYEYFLKSPFYSILNQRLT